MRYRTYFSLAAAGIIILLIAALRPSVKYSDTANQLQADRFWIMKAQNKSQYDVVILGDSRTYRGVSPAEISKSLPTLSVYNFAFSSGGLNPEMYKAADELLKHDSKQKTIVIGITASSLLSLHENNQQYNQEHNRPHSAYLERVYVNNHLEKFLPFDHNDIFALIKGNSSGVKYYSQCMDNGWVASNKTPEDTTEQLPSTREELQQYQVQPALVKSLLQQTKQWTSQGVKVVGFRPPTTLAMQQMEDELSNLDFNQLAIDFEAAGGKWVNIDRAQFHSYDGSHLTEESAIKLSQLIGNEIANTIKPTNL